MAKVLDVFFNMISVVSVEEPQAPISEALQKGNIHILIQARLFPYIEQCVCRDKKHLAKYIQFDFSRDIPRQASRFLASIRKDNCLSPSIGCLSCWYSGSWLGRYLSSNDVSKWRLTLSGQIHSQRCI